MTQYAGLVRDDGRCRTLGLSADQRDLRPRSTRNARAARRCSTRNPRRSASPTACSRRSDRQFWSARRRHARRASRRQRRTRRPPRRRYARGSGIRKQMMAVIDLDRPTISKPLDNALRLDGDGSCPGQARSRATRIGSMPRCSRSMARAGIGKSTTTSSNLSAALLAARQARAPDRLRSQARQRPSP